MNKLKEFENDSHGVYLDEGNVLKHFYREAHRQLPWQVAPASHPEIVRYFKIYNHGDLRRVFEKSLGFEPLSFFQYSFAILACFLKEYFIELDFSFNIDKLSKTTIKDLLEHFSGDIEEIKSQIKKEEKFDHRFIYQFNPLRETPVVVTKYSDEEGYICPIPSLFFRRFTSGVYYDLVSSTSGGVDFGNSFGASFESYVGDVLQSSLEEEIDYEPEAQYKIGKDLIKTPDWIVHDSGAVMFLECKTKRVTLKTKQSLYKSDSSEKDFSKLSKAIVQLYRRIVEYKDNHFPQLDYDKNLRIFPVVLTLERWFTAPEGINEIHKRVEAQMKEEGLSTDLLQQIPYDVIACGDFEILTQLISEREIKEVLNPRVDDEEKRRWPFNAFLQNEFPKHNKDAMDLFPDTKKRLFVTEP